MSPEQRSGEPAPTHERETPEPPRIYVASLSDYNNGRLHGAWLDAAQPVEKLHEQVHEMLERSPEPLAEEYAVHDYDGFRGYQPAEYDSLSRVSKIANGIVEHGPAFGAWAEHCDEEDGQLDRFDEAYRGEWASLVGYVDELLDDLGASDVLEQVPAWLQPYVQLNVEALARDMELGGDVWSTPAEEGVYVFDGTL